MPASSREQIGELFVDFTTEGADDAQKQMEQLGKKAEVAADAMQKAFNRTGAGELQQRLSSMSGTMDKLHHKSSGGGGGGGLFNKMFGGLFGKGGGAGAGAGAGGGAGAGAAVGALGAAAGAIAAAGAVAAKAVLAVAEKFVQLGLAGLHSSADILPLNNVLERASRVIGGAFMPIVNMLTDTFERAMPGIRGFSEMLGNTFGEVLAALKPIIDIVIKAFNELGAFLKMLSEWRPFGGPAPKKVYGGYKELTPNTGSSGVDTNISSLYQRIQTAANKQVADRDYAKETADGIKAMDKRLEALEQVNRDGNGLLRDIKEKKQFAP